MESVVRAQRMGLLACCIVSTDNNGSGLFQDFDKMNIRTGHYTPLANGWSPSARPIKEYLKCVFDTFSGPCDSIVAHMGDGAAADMVPLIWTSRRIRRRTRWSPG